MESDIAEELLCVEAELQEVQDQIKLLLDRQERLCDRQSELRALLEQCKVSGDTSKDDASVEDWSGAFEWDSVADDTRFNVFGISSYRANQREIINAVMSGRDVLVIMAAGGGKSLCYQLPAVLRDGIVLVVSPLLSLIQDQVMGLAALGIPGHMLTSITSKEDEKFIYKALEKGDGDLKILFVTPEKISKSKRFMSKLEKCHHGGRLCLIAIDVAKELCERGILADYYHADMDIVAREKVHLRWSNNRLQVIVGTVAFGMGINKPDVRFVIHHSLSKSMETYYQESGRAGRDGLPSECVLYFRPGDVPRQSSMVFYENSGLQNLYDMVQYCQSRRACRRSAFFRHFGERVQDCNGMCDNCAYGKELKEIDVTYHAKVLVLLLRDLQENDQRATILQLLDRFKVKMKELSRSANPVSDLKKEDLEQLIIQLILDRVLKEEFQHTAYATNAYVALGPLWKQASLGKRTVKLEVCIRQKHEKSGTLNDSKRGQLSGLETKLDELRKELSSSHGGIFPHAVLSTQQISILSAKKPKSITELEKLIGKVKAEKYGARIIDLIQQYTDAEQPNGTAAEAEGNENASNRRPAEGSENKDNKRRRKNKALVLIDSSEDENVYN